jgi:aryl-alcohol dehydrogenase-like predicted oxidoreductase
VEYIRLTNTDLVVSRIAFGCEPLGGMDWGRVDADEVAGAVRTAIDLGINFFDTADVYGLGRSEERLAKALGENRKEAVIASKFGIGWVADPGSGRARTFRNASARRVREALEASLRRLQLKCIPLYFLHWPDPGTPLEETLAALERERQAGKIRYIGLSNCSAATIAEAARIAPIAAVQVQYSLISRQAEEDLLPLCRRSAIGVLAYGVLAQGLLSGKIDAAARFGPDDRRSRLPHFAPENLSRHVERQRRVYRLAAAGGQTQAQFAVRWVLDQPGVACAIVGAKRPAQIVESAGAADRGRGTREWAQPSA